MARVVIEHVRKTFPGCKGKEQAAVHDVSLAIEDKEFFVLVGPSGCGKSTLLRLIAGLEEPTSGTISIGEQVVNAVLPKDRDVAMVFQNYALYPHLTVRENLAFALELRKTPRAVIKQRVQEAADLLGLSDYLDRLPKALSGGQRQRVAVGRAMVRQPKVFLFDEPLSNLDAQMRAQMRLELLRLHNRVAATMIYVTHDQVEAMTMGDRIAVMKDGRLQQLADPLTLYQYPANLFVAAFIGSPAMNFFRGELRPENGVSFQGESRDAERFVLSLPSDPAHPLAAHVGKPVVLGVRPENISAGITTAQQACVNALVELVEPLGADTIFHLTLGGHSFVARLGAGERAMHGQKIAVAFDLAKAHFFDAITEERIALEQAP